MKALLYLLVFLLGLQTQAQIFSLCCDSPSGEVSYDTCRITQPCIEAFINADGTIGYQNPNALFQVTSSQLTSGTGTNNNGGQEYILNFPDFGINGEYFPHVTILEGIQNQSLNEGDFTLTNTSIRYGLFSGDDGNGVDDADPSNHIISISGCSKIVIDTIYSDSSGGNGGNSVTILPDCPQLTTNFFNEAQFAWGFGVQNNSASPVSQWQAVIENANYQIDDSKISNNSDFTYTEIANPDGSFNHVFTSNSGLSAFGSAGPYQFQFINFGFNPSSDGINIGCN